MAYSTRPLRQQLISVYFLLLLVVTMLFVIGMPGLVGADWPGWTSTVLVAYLLSLLLAALSLAASGWMAYAARWGIAIGVLVAVGRVTWSLYDAGERAAFLALALLPVLVAAAAAVLLLWFVWPRAAVREIADAAAAHGWQTYRELPDDVKLPATPLPLPVRRPWVVRNVVRGNGGLAFEVRWLESLRRKRLAVFVGPALPVGLPGLQVRPSGPSSVALETVADDIDLESEQFNRAFEVRGADRRYVTDMLHPRTMRLLLDARPIGLLVDRDSVVGCREGGLDAAALRTGLTTVTQVAAGIPGHVLDRWGTRVGSQAASRLRFAGRTWSRTVFGAMVLALGASAGLLCITLAWCLAAAAAEHNSRGEEFVPPDYSVGTLVIVAAVLAVVAGCCGAIDRLIARLGTREPRPRATGVAA